MCWGILKTEAEYNKAMARLDEIFDSRKGTKEGDELELLLLIIEHYEDFHFPIPDPDPVGYIKYIMELKGFNQSDLAKVIGSKSRASEILNKKRKLTLEMIRKISSFLQIEVVDLVKDYDLVG